MANFLTSNSKNNDMLKEYMFTLSSRKDHLEFVASGLLYLEI